MASASGLRARVPASQSEASRRRDDSADQTPLLDEEAVLSKHQMMEERTLEIELEHVEVEKKEKEWLCFRDGKRLIDYVIVYETPSNEDDLKEEAKEKLSEKAEKREKFRQNLLEAGLEIEEEEEVTTKDDKTKTRFWKIHAPWDTLSKTAEDIMMKMPIKESDIQTKNWYEEHVRQGIRDMIHRNNPFEIQDPSTIRRRNYFMGYFKRDRLEIYVGHQNKDTFFSTTERSRMVEQICSHVRFSEERYDVGVRRLLHDECITAAYPLHPGSEECSEGEPPTNDRQRLRRDWARFGRWFKFQPYDAIKDYFGTEIGLYFSWLGFYTIMLIPAALFGMVVFLYGIINARSFQPVIDVCNKSNEEIFYMCPLCDSQCPYWSLISSCYYSIATIRHFSST